MEKKSFWSLLAMFLLGILVGFAFAPIKKGVNVRVCNNCNVLKDEQYEDLYDFDDEDCDCDDSENSVEF